MCLTKEIIKVPYIDLIPKVIPWLFTYIAPSCSEDVTRAMRGETKRLSRNYLRRNGAKCEVILCFDFQKTFHNRDVIYTQSKLLWL